MKTPEEQANELLIETAKAVAVEGYKDVLHPTFKAVGNILALPIQAIDAALTKPKLWVAEKQYNYERTKMLLAEKLKDVSPEKIVEPENYVAIPALQQISYCFDSDELRDMYVNLLATSMNADKKWSVHPAFVDIIKQLTPDEAKLLRYLSRNTHRPYPIIDVNIKSEINKGFYTLLTNYTDIGDHECDYPENISTYLENLDRLKIIEIDKSNHLIDDTQYDSIINSAYIQEKTKIKMNDGEYSYGKSVFNITSFGVGFINACIKSGPTFTVEIE